MEKPTIEEITRLRCRCVVQAWRMVLGEVPPEAFVETAKEEEGAVAPPPVPAFAKRLLVELLVEEARQVRDKLLSEMAQEMNRGVAAAEAAAAGSGKEWQPQAAVPTDEAQSLAARIAGMGRLEGEAFQLVRKCRTKKGDRWVWDEAKLAALPIEVLRKVVS